jgi:hypothetical protein
MPLTLEQYASYLDTRDLPWPAAPEVDPPKAKPHLKRLRGIRAVLWNVYGTLLAIPGGELYFEHPQKLQMDVALDKTVQEFKMWGSMTRKPGQPGEYLGQLYSMALAEQRGVTTGGEKHPEVSAERVWEALIKKLLQKEYKFDAGFYGAEGIQVRRRLLWSAQRVQPQGGVLLPRQPAGDRLLPWRGAGPASGRRRRPGAGVACRRAVLYKCAASARPDRAGRNRPPG